MAFVQQLSTVVSSLPTPVFLGKVLECVGLVVESECPGASIGLKVDILLSNREDKPIPAEVIGFRQGRVLLMTYYSVIGMSPGDRVRTSTHHERIAVGDALIGRVLNGFGEPIDDLGELLDCTFRKQTNVVRNPLSRSSINETIVTGIRAIDGLLTLGKGQRVGLMAGSGVGKSVLLSSICKQVNADINVIALIGERGREVEEFVHQTLGDEGLKKSVIIAATAQDSPLLRCRAAFRAIAIAEHFAEQGKNVFLTMDSITRFATAMREIGLAVGEPPTVKGYTPSVFAAIPDLIERCGNFKNSGSITSIFTVLADGDDFNDPVVDSVRAILDGHIVLTRQLAESGHYPAIDISKSVSRLFNQLNNKDDVVKSRQLKQIFSSYVQNKDLMELGLFETGESANREKLKIQWKALEAFLVQDLDEYTSLSETHFKMSKIGESA